MVSRFQVPETNTGSTGYPIYYVKSASLSCDNSRRNSTTGENCRISLNEKVPHNKSSNVKLSTSTSKNEKVYICLRMVAERKIHPALFHCVTVKTFSVINRKNFRRK